jgi:hypothetical protein
LHSAITPLIRFILRSLLPLLVIAIILAGGRFLLEQGRMLSSSNEELTTLVKVNADITAYKQGLISLVRLTARKAGNESLYEVNARIRVVSETVRENGTEQGPSLFLSPLAGPGKLRERLVSYYKSRLISEVAGQEWSRLLRRVLVWALAGLVLLGAAEIFLGHHLPNGPSRYLVAGAILVFLMLEIAGVLHHISHLGTWIETKSAKWLREYFDGNFWKSPPNRWER